VTSDVTENEVTEEIGLSEEEESDDARVLLTSVRVARDVNQRPIHTLRAVTTVPESERTAIPAAEKTVNGTEVTEAIVVTAGIGEIVESVVIAADAISMTDLDETYLTNDPDVAAVMIAETAETRIVVVKEGGVVVEEEELVVVVVAATAVDGEALHHHRRKNPLQI
jgi:hypothetical protein